MACDGPDRLEPRSTDPRDEAKSSAMGKQHREPASHATQSAARPRRHRRHGRGTANDGRSKAEKSHRRRASISHEPGCARSRRGAAPEPRAAGGDVAPALQIQRCPLEATRRPQFASVFHRRFRRGLVGGRGGPEGESRASEIEVVGKTAPPWWYGGNASSMSIAKAGFRQRSGKSEALPGAGAPRGDAPKGAQSARARTPRRLPEFFESDERPWHDPRASRGRGRGASSMKSIGHVVAFEDRAIASKPLARDGPSTTNAHRRRFSAGAPGAPAREPRVARRELQP